MRAREPVLCGVLDHAAGDDGPGRRHCTFPACQAARALAAAGGGEAALFGKVREHAEPVIGWARSEEALPLEQCARGERAMADGLELVRPLTQSRLDLRALRERRRGDYFTYSRNNAITTAATASPSLPLRDPATRNALSLTEAHPLRLRGDLRDGFFSGAKSSHGRVTSGIAAEKGRP